MTQHWVFQANPRLYDINAALQQIDRIWWRTPQHTADIQVGDVVAIWRSGPESGFVGVGRVLAPPQQHAPGEDDARFALADDEGEAVTTRVLLAVRPADLVTKEQVRAVPELHEHQIVRAPMGTVFRVSAEEWQVISSLLPTPPDAEPEPSVAAELPPVFAWEQRAKGVLPMPGGYDGYLASARRVCSIVDDLRPTPHELVGHLRQEFDVSENAAKLRESFLRKMGLIRVDGGSCHVSDSAKRWLESEDNQVVIGLLHSRCRFIGELLAECTVPKSAEELLTIVNDRYGLEWDTLTQINNRRGWLQSGGMVRPNDSGQLVLTEAGRVFLGRLDLFRPGDSEIEGPASETPAPAAIVVAPRPEPLPSEVDQLARELETASTNSSDPNRFERAVRDAFQLLGFQADWMGGSGRTDVLLDALLGRDESYRVTVDAKTTGSGSLSDQQIDWTTLVEHREQHDADFSALVGPNPASGRLAERATSHGVAVLSAVQLAGLCRQHARTPLGLDDYRALFESGGPVDTTLLDEQSEVAQRFVDLAVTLCRTLEERTPVFGRLKARDLWLIVGGDHVE